MTVVDLYTIQIMRDEGPMAALGALDASLHQAVAECEENMTDLLPPGYRARIRRWDHPDPDEGDK